MFFAVGRVGLGKDAAIDNAKVRQSHSIVASLSG
jgi:hypothetical protein